MDQLITIQSNGGDKEAPIMRAQIKEHFHIKAKGRRTTRRADISRLKRRWRRPFFHMMMTSPNEHF